MQTLTIEQVFGKTIPELLGTEMSLAAAFDELIAHAELIRFCEELLGVLALESLARDIIKFNQP